MTLARTTARFALVLSLGLSLSVVGCASSSATSDAASAAPSAAASDTTADDRDRRFATGSVDTIDATEMNDRNVSRLADLIQGNAAGVRVTQGPGGGIVVRIRGTNSIYGSNDPLYVVDGMPVRADPGGGLSSVNPYDVKSITILKDAAETSIYGMQGANGVIVIETKDR